MFKALMVLTFWSDFKTKYVTLWYASTCFCCFLFFFFFFLSVTRRSCLLKIFKWITKMKKMKEDLLALLGRKTIKSSIVQYARLLDFLTKKLKLCSWLQIKGVMNHTFVANFFFFFLSLFWGDVVLYKNNKKKQFWSHLCTLHLP